MLEAHLAHNQEYAGSSPVPATTYRILPMKNSRGPNIDTQKCVEIAGGNKYDLVLIIADRARELAKKNMDNEQHEYNNPIVTALLELQSGQLDKTSIG